MNLFQSQGSSSVNQETVVSRVEKAWNTKTRILFFIGKLGAGGKERRLVELLTHLKSKGKYEMMLVMTKDIIGYQSFYELKVPYVVINKKSSKSDFTVFLKFHKICKQFSPHVVHTWGAMQTFYTLPSVIWERIPLINSQISSAPPHVARWSVSELVNRINFYFSEVILSNSKAGVQAFKPPLSKTRVIYNGIRMSRFSDLPAADEVKAKYGIRTSYAVVMVANFTPNKDYKLFCRVAEAVFDKRKDVTFIGVGTCCSDDSHSLEVYKEAISKSKTNANLLFLGQINDVEALVNACDVGVLFSPNGEGISNSILEYMALAKPVIASAAGGTLELVHHNKSGFLISDANEEKVAALILDLLGDQEKISSFGRESRKIIEDNFTLDKMGQKFEKVYEDVLVKSKMV